jgi:hypothetical protein
MKISEKRLAILFGVVSVLSLAVLLLPDAWLRLLLYKPLPAWTWIIDVSLRLLSFGTATLALYRFVIYRRSSPFVYLGLTTLILVMLFEAGVSRLYQSPVRLEATLSYVSITLLAFEFSRVRHYTPFEKRQEEREPKGES